MQPAKPRDLRILHSSSADFTSLLARGNAAGRSAGTLRCPKSRGRRGRLEDKGSAPAGVRWQYWWLNDWLGLGCHGRSLGRPTLEGPCFSLTLGRRRPDASQVLDRVWRIMQPNQCFADYVFDQTTAIHGLGWAHQRSQHR